MNNGERIAVVDLPIPVSSAKELADGQRLLTKARRIYVDDRDVLKALPIYVKAAEAGNLDAFREMCEIFDEDGGSSIQDEMLQALEGAFFPHEPTDKDIEFVKDLSTSEIGDIAEDDVRKLLHVAQYYHVLETCAESTIEWIRNSDDASNDDSWMFPDGHDDGESSD